jgi:cyanophycinase
MTTGRGPLIIIGGHEDREGDRVVLRAVADALHGGKLVLATVASHRHEGYLSAYQAAFAGLGVGEIVELYVAEREDADDAETLALLDGAAGVFFSGGDQLRITATLGHTPVEARIRELWEGGGLLAGTSAGASAMSGTMIVQGPSTETHRIGDLQMAPGLGLVPDVILDQHFAERGRIGRLLGAVAQNPRVLGVGIDEDTAILVQGDRFQVLGSGGVYVADGADITRSNIAEAKADSALSLFDARLHLLSAGDAFDLVSRRPTRLSEADEEG